MNRRTIVPSEQISQHHYAGVSPIQPFSYASQRPAPPRKSIQQDTDAITQTRSFQMLEGWISDSEKSMPSTNQSTGQLKVIIDNNDRLRLTLSAHRGAFTTQSMADQQNYSSRRFSAGAPVSHPSRSFRYLQQQYATDNSAPPSARDSAAFRRSSDIPTPYRPVQRDTSERTPVNRFETVNNRDDLTEIYSKLPPSFRAREPEAKRFTGSSNPSRAFRFLQKMTDDDQRNDPSPVTGYIKPQQLLHKNNHVSSVHHTESANDPDDDDC